RTRLSMAGGSGVERLGVPPALIEGWKPVLSLAARFWQYVKLGPANHQRSRCYIWVGSVDHAGQPRINLPGHRYLSARHLSWLLAHGELPARRLYRARECDARCVRTEHLSPEPLRLVPPPGPRPRPTAWRLLTREQVARIKEAASNGTPLVVLAQRYNVHASTISAAVRGKTWKHVARGNSG